MTVNVQVFLSYALMFAAGLYWKQPKKSSKKWVAPLLLVLSALFSTCR